MIDRRYARALSLLVPIVVWHGVVSAGLVSQTVLPPPLSIAETTVASLGESTFRGHVLATLVRTALASAIAAPLGTLVGFAMAVDRDLRAVLSPVTSAVFALPTVAMFPLLILVVGTTGRALVLTAAIGAFVLVVWNARDGARSIDHTYVELARDNGATSRSDLVREVWLPGSLPLLLVGLRLGLSMSLLIVTAVEFVAADSGLGYVLWISWTAYRLPEMYAALVIVGVVGMAITYGLAALSDRLLPWAPDAGRTAIAP
ncbi:MAG: ABC transporter permease [archaeon]